MMQYQKLEQALARMANAENAAHLQRFFKTGPGEYAEGDLFLGIRMPRIRRLVRDYPDMPLAQVTRLLHSRFHEQRMAALLILTGRYGKAGEKERADIYRCYLDNTRWINNWDLVDVTVAHIVGAHLWKRSRAPLYHLAQSNSLWERRIAIVATIYFIRCNQFADTLNIADRLLRDGEDLIHKATGWMLREVGKRDPALMEGFLVPRYGFMPRTMLRYAIEKLPEPRRQAYLKGRI